MDENELKKLSDIAVRLNSFTSVLQGYCQNYDEDIPKISNLVEFSELLHNTSNELFDLL